MTTETRQGMAKEMNRVKLEQLLETATETGQVFEALGKCNATFEIRTHLSLTNMKFYKNLEDGVVFRQQPETIFYAVVRHNDALVYLARIEK